MAKTEKFYTWIFILYPESAPSNWLNILKDMHMKCAISPLHSADPLDTDDKQQFKDHHHIFLKFDNQVNFDYVKEITDSINATRPEHPRSESGSIRYWIHFDDPDKQQFDKNPDNIICLGGYDVTDFFLCKDHDVVLIDRLEDLIINNNFDNFLMFMKFLKANMYLDELQFLRKNSYYISKVLDGAWQLNHQGYYGGTYVPELEKE